MHAPTRQIIYTFFIDVNYNTLFACIWRTLERDIWKKERE